MHDILETLNFLPLQGMFVVLVLAMLFEVGQVVYRLVWHPLASFPGPKIAAATNLYGAYYDLILDGSLCKKVAQLHTMYGTLSIITLTN